MSIVGDIHDELNAKTNAQELEDILLKASMQSFITDDEVYSFIKNNLYQWYYLIECSNGKVSPNIEIIKFFT